MRSFFYGADKALAPHTSERQAFEDCLGDMSNNTHDVTPDSRRVEDVWGTSFQRAHDGVGNLLRVSKMCGVCKVIGHWSLG